MQRSLFGAHTPHHISQHAHRVVHAAPTVRFTAPTMVHAALDAPAPELCVRLGLIRPQPALLPLARLPHSIAHHIGSCSHICRPGLHNISTGNYADQQTCTRTRTPAHTHTHAQDAVVFLTDGQLGCSSSLAAKGGEPGAEIAMAGRHARRV